MIGSAYIGRSSLKSRVIVKVSMRGGVGTRPSLMWNRSSASSGTGSGRTDDGDELSKRFGNYSQTNFHALLIYCCTQRYDSVIFTDDRFVLKHGLLCGHVHVPR